MDRYRIARLIFWFGVGVIIGFLVVSLTSCGPPTPQPYVVQPAQVVSVQQSAIDGVVDEKCEWKSIANPVVTCSARVLNCKSGLGITECVFVRCGEGTSLSCIRR